MRTGLYAVWKGMHMKCGEVRVSWKVTFFSVAINAVWVGFFVLELPRYIWPEWFRSNWLIWQLLIWNWPLWNGGFSGFLEVITWILIPAVITGFFTLWVCRKEMNNKREKLKYFSLSALLGVAIFWLVFFVLGFIVIHFLWNWH